MALLADRIRAGQIRTSVIADVDPAHASQHVEWMREDIADAPIIVIDARTIMEILGHSQIGTTMSIYAHVMPAMQREAADRMDAVLGGAM